ncbi:hypothetical protein TTHERM_00259510 (macronuclear) [Tetrahymena thermophila SB210]|uniref:Transmembrane protein n=1 Tax=Tetrahymena thermophila (strain SB210) TaxID=312017 RepID=Q22UD5_TETTS|nr:hypothetical protein TTHERM_00259510 [Tetrahymena thermophila SB210]EAR88752.1 hypothetical protein TTHERM_00259510 [Tetrahymena thermophila SB210]|eukprot:XP_001008997.1 hypothetical protein TTHERM_00259510 [Tetrahymena thermophila SB210]
MQKLLITLLFFALFISQSVAQNECLDNCNISHYNCIGQQENLMDFKQRKQCEGERSICFKQCKAQNPILSVLNEFKDNFIVTKSSDDDNVQQCQDNCKRNMFKCQISCKNQGAKCNLDCEMTYRSCLSLTCQQQ